MDTHLKAGSGQPTVTWTDWRSFEAVKYATLEWVDWSNNKRLLAPIGNIPPVEAEQRFYAMLLDVPLAA